MSDTIKVLGLVGSFRRAGYNGMALRAAIELTPPGMLIESHDYRDIPFYYGDLEDESGIPAPVKALGEKIRAADALLIVTPEYNTSLPGLLKNALDWVSREPQGSFGAKPVAIMGASPGTYGTVRAQQHLRRGAAQRRRPDHAKTAGDDHQCGPALQRRRQAYRRSHQGAYRQAAHRAGGLDEAAQEVSEVFFV